MNVIVLATKKDMPILKICVPHIQEHIEDANIIIIANQKDRKVIECIAGVTFYDEETIFEGLSYKTVEQLIYKRVKKQSRTGWYLQQFLKMAWAYIEKNEEYIIVDADTIIFSDLKFKENNMYCFTRKIEYHKPYFECMERLFQGEVNKIADFSFIAEHMIINRNIMIELIDRINKNEALEGDNFYERIINAINIEDLLYSGFSEFETYGNYMMKYYPEQMKIRKLRTLRTAMYYLSGCPNESALEWASKSYDIISIEDPNYRGRMAKVLDLRCIRKCLKLDSVVHVHRSVNKLLKREVLILDD